MESSSQPTAPDWTSLVRSIVLFAINAILVLVLLSWVFGDLTQFGSLAGETVVVRLIPAFALGAASLGGTLAYMTVGLVAPERGRLFRRASGVCALVALALLLAKAFGPVLGFA